MGMYSLSLGKTFKTIALIFDVHILGKADLEMVIVFIWSFINLDALSVSFHMTFNYYQNCSL